MSLKHSVSNSPNLLNINNELTSDPIKIANVFSNYFSSIEEKIQSKTSFSHKHYTDYVHGENLNSFLLNLQTVEKLFSLYPHSVIANLLVEIIEQQKY